MVRPTVGDILLDVQRTVGEKPQKSTQSTQKWSEEIPADSLEISAYQKSHSTCWDARKYFFLAHLDWRVEYCGYWDAASVDLHPLLFWPLFQKQQLQAVSMDNENSTRITIVCRVICNSLSTFQFSSYLFFFSTALPKRWACINGNMAHTKMLEVSVQQRVGRESVPERVHRWTVETNLVMSSGSLRRCLWCAHVLSASYAVRPNKC